jgi:mono/diheme cytochrome c family protein
MHRVLVPVAACVLLPAVVAPAQEVGSPAAGLALAERWCAECHLVSGQAATPVPAGAPPSFQSVAADPAVTELWLRTFFVTPHPVMPNIRPSPDQVDDLVAYILSLKSR